MALPSGRGSGEFRLRFGWHLALCLALSLIASAGTGMVLWWYLSAPVRGEPLAPTDRLELVKIALAVTGGLGAVVALVVAYRRQHVIEAEHRIRAVGDQREQTKLFNERFGRAADQLGSDNPAVRLAGVYALAGLADDWPVGRQTCIDVLCGYLRMPYTADGGSDQERQVRHTVIRLIGTHLRTGATVSWQGLDLDFTGVVFDGGDFAGAVFSDGMVSFIGATFASGVVDFIGAGFRGATVDFRSALFSGGTVHFTRATFASGTVNFTRARFTGGLVNFVDATFSGATVNFRRADLAHGTVAFTGATLAGGVVDFIAAGFHGAAVVFTRARFRGATVTFVGATLSSGSLIFRGVDFASGTADFTGAKLLGTRVVFTLANFSGGTAELSMPRSYDRPPVFDRKPGAPPEGLRLPDK
jgi:uncharacterized protein YjbI with pentapeptide repeats